MVESTTKNYGWTKPEVTKSSSTWGGFLNTDLDSIDSLVFTNQQGIVPIGSMTMFGGAAAPANWLLCQGQTLDYGVTPAYQGLFNVIGRAFNTALTGTQFALPNLTQRLPLGAGTTALGVAGGGAGLALATANLPPHAHPIVDVAHNHGVNQWAHSHVIATGGHSHAIHTGGHNHTVGGGVIAGSGLTNGGTNLQVGSSTTSTAGDLGGNTDAAGNLGGNSDTQTSAISLGASGTGLSTTQNTGSGAAVAVPLPPFLAINFIIRYQ